MSTWDFNLKSRKKDVISEFDEWTWLDENVATVSINEILKKIIKLFKNERISLSSKLPSILVKVH